MKTNIFLITLLAAALCSCQQEDYAPKLAGTYSGTYSSPTDTFTGNLYISTISKNKVKVTLLTDSGFATVTSSNVLVDDDGPDQYSFMDINGEIYHVLGRYNHKDNLIELSGFYNTMPSTNFEGSKQ